MNVDKFVKALARHELAKQKVDALSRRIGSAIERCPVVIKSNDWTISNAERADIWDEKTQHHKTHLWMAFNALSHYGEHFDEDGQRESLLPRNDGCRHCYRAFELIHKRKEAREELGYARLSIRALGKVALQMVGGDE